MKRKLFKGALVLFCIQSSFVGACVYSPLCAKTVLGSDDSLQESTEIDLKTANRFHRMLQYYCSSSRVHVKYQGPLGEKVCPQGRMIRSPFLLGDDSGSDWRWTLTPDINNLKDAKPGMSEPFVTLRISTIKPSSADGICRINGTTLYLTLLQDESNVKMDSPLGSGGQTAKQLIRSFEAFADVFPEWENNLINSTSFEEIEEKADLLDQMVKERETELQQSRSK